MKNRSLNSKGTVLISGGVGGIGQSCAIKLAKLGYDIAFTWRSSKKKATTLENKIKSIGRNCTAIELHLENDNIEEKFQQIDKLISSPLVGLVNNAGILKDNFIGMIPKKDMDNIMNINLIGPIIFTQLVSKIIKKNFTKVSF